MLTNCNSEVKQEQYFINTHFKNSQCSSVSKSYQMSGFQNRLGPLFLQHTWGRLGPPILKALQCCLYTPGELK